MKVGHLVLLFLGNIEMISCEEEEKSISAYLDEATLVAKDVHLKYGGEPLPYLDGEEGGDWLMSTFFYLNILWYLAYCRFIALETFKATSDEAYEFVRDTCIEGAYYELMMSTQKSEQANKQRNALSEDQKEAAKIAEQKSDAAIERLKKEALDGLKNLDKD